ncbi:MAG: TIGR03936 family radical SAM-associated protein [Anaerolineae bacterium]|nr:TIGR03936 family radical SAM-associated protein [Anaerolineae bacterium]
MSHVSPVAQRLRITFGKTGSLRYTSSLDVAKIWERVLRRADLPIMYTQGFNTRPRIRLAMPLPLGISSECEILDVSLRQRIDVDEAALRSRLLAVAPQGLTIGRIVEVDLRASTLHSLIDSAEYRIHFVDEVDPEYLRLKISEIMNRKSIIIDRTRRRKRSVMDIRPLILALYLDDAHDMIAHLSVGDRGNLRPDQLIELMELSEFHHSVHRYKLHTIDG